MKNQVNIALIGYGVVGSGTMRMLKENIKDIESRVGADVNVTWVCSRHKKDSPWLDKSIHQTRNWRKIIADPDVDLVVELIGGTDPARQIVTSALKAGKHVVTANKALLSKYWNDIFGLAQEKHKLVYFEAAVGGGVPIVQAINEGLAGNRIRRIVGILNGTTNYILTKMQESNESYAKALKDAQRAGFAETDPSFDVDGVDAAQKISILGSLASGQWIAPQHVYCEGITGIKPLDMRLIREKLNCVIKLLAIAEPTQRGWVLRVHPTVVSKRHPFANVRNEYNAISVVGDAVSDVMLYGKGAGQLPSASAVVSDIIFLCRQIANGTAGQIPYVSNHSAKAAKVGSMDRIESRYYLRINTLDKPGALAKITALLGRYHVSLASVHQDLSDESERTKRVSVILVTHMTREMDVQAAVKAINNLSTTKSSTALLRME